MDVNMLLLGVSSHPVLVHVFLYIRLRLTCYHAVFCKTTLFFTCELWIKPHLFPSAVCLSHTDTHSKSKVINCPRTSPPLWIDVLFPPAVFESKVIRRTVAELIYAQSSFSSWLLKDTNE